MTSARSPNFYRPERAEGVYDAIVIGSGMGGLATAAFLSKAGRRVLVLERHYAIGGFTHTFRRKQWEWDVGLHYVGEFHRDGTLPAVLMHDICEGRLKWAPMPDVYDRVVFPDGHHDFHSGRERFVEGLLESFPRARSALQTYIELSDRAYASAMRCFQEKALPAFLAPLARPFLCREFLRYAGRTTLGTLQGLTNDPRLIGVLSGQWGTYGLPPAESSFAIHGIVASHYMDGAAYPVGGAASIARSVLPTIEATGGRVLLSAEVQEILVRGGRAGGVRMKGGQELRAPIVISGAGVRNTFGSLLGESSRREPASRIGPLRPSTAHISLYVGLDETAESADLQPTNLWIYPHHDHDRTVQASRRDPDAPLPVVYVSFPSAKDPTWRDRRGATATLEVISFVDYERFSRWENERWRKRGSEYEEVKAGYSERLLDALYAHVPQVKGKITYHELSTPLSTRHFTNHPDGEIYGLNFTPERFAQRGLGPRTRIRGLYLTGQDTVAHGIVGALFSGVVTASVVLGRNVIADVRRRSEV